MFHAILSFHKLDLCQHMSTAILWYFPETNENKKMFTLLLGVEFLNSMKWYFPEQKNNKNQKSL